MSKNTIRIRIAGYALTKGQFADLVGEFFGKITFQDADPAMECVSFTGDDAADFQIQFLTALGCFKRRK